MPGNIHIGVDGVYSTISLPGDTEFLLLRIDSNGIAHRVAGGPASMSSFERLGSIAVGADGSLYIIDMADLKDEGVHAITAVLSERCMSYPSMVLLARAQRLLKSIINKATAI